MGHVAGIRRGPDPAGHRARDGLYIGLQRSVEADMPGGMRPDDAHHRGVRAAGVVQVGQAVAQAGAEVQQHGGRAPRDARVPIGRAGRDPLEQPEHAAHARHRVQRVHEVHLRGAGIHEAHVNARADQAGDQGMGPDHGGVARGGRLIRHGWPEYFAAPPGRTFRATGGRALRDIEQDVRQPQGPLVSSTGTESC